MEKGTKEDLKIIGKILAAIFGVFIIFFPLFYFSSRPCTAPYKFVTQGTLLRIIPERYNYDTYIIVLNNENYYAHNPSGFFPSTGECIKIYHRELTLSCRSPETVLRQCNDKGTP